MKKNLLTSILTGNNGLTNNSLIVGQPGCGKTSYVIKPLITEFIKKSLPGVIYDFSDSNLSKVAFDSFSENLSSNSRSQLEFSFVNFSDITKSNRINILSDKNVSSPDNGRRFQLLGNLLSSLTPSWQDKNDWWSKNTIWYLFEIAMKCYYERDKGINTLPHVLEFALSDSNKVMEWIGDSENSAYNWRERMATFSQNKDRNGAVALNVLNQFRQPNIYWVLSPSDEDSCCLDINNLKPTVLCLADESGKYSTLFSLILYSTYQLLNESEEETPSFSLLDEFQSLNFKKGLPLLPCSNTISVLSIQAMEQLDIKQLQFFNRVIVGKTREEVIINSFPQASQLEIGEFIITNYDNKICSTGPIKLDQYINKDTNIPVFQKISDEDVSLRFDNIKNEVYSILKH